MPVKPVHEPIVARISNDPKLQRVMLVSFIELLLEGDDCTARLTLRDLVNGTIGFVALGEKLDKNSKSLMRMLSVDGNPTTENLFQIFRALKDHINVEISVTADVA